MCPIRSSKGPPSPQCDSRLSVKGSIPSTQPTFCNCSHSIGIQAPYCQVLVDPLATSHCTRKVGALAPNDVCDVRTSKVPCLFLETTVLSPLGPAVATGWLP
jgi:hypothetical protein